jgi:hypothetical protein
VDKLEHVYYEQEGAIEDTIERVLIEDNGMDSSNSSGESSDMLESEGLSGVEGLVED